MALSSPKEIKEPLEVNISCTRSSKWFSQESVTTLDFLTNECICFLH